MGHYYLLILVFWRGSKIHINCSLFFFKKNSTSNVGIVIIFRQFLTYIIKKLSLLIILSITTHRQLEIGNGASTSPTVESNINQLHGQLLFRGTARPIKGGPVSSFEGIPFAQSPNYSTPLAFQARLSIRILLFLSFVHYIRL